MYKCMYTLLSNTFNSNPEELWFIIVCFFILFTCISSFISSRSLEGIFPLWDVKYGPVLCQKMFLLKNRDFAYFLFEKVNLCLYFV